MMPFLRAVYENAQKAADETAKKVVAQPEAIDQITKLLEVIIWPITVFAGILLFRKHFSTLLSRVGNLKVGPTGLEMTLLDEQLEEAKVFIPSKTPVLLAKDGGGIIRKDGGGIISKDGSDPIPNSNSAEIHYQTSHAETPQLELLDLQEAINQKLNSVATQNNMSNGGSSNLALTINLENQKVITSTTALQLKKLIELTNIGLNTTQLSYDQVIQMKKLFVNIAF